VVTEHRPGEVPPAKGILGPRAEVPSDSRDQGDPPDLQLYRPNMEPDSRLKQEAAGPLYDFPLC
jgi:hypothetical protein